MTELTKIRSFLAIELEKPALEYLSDVSSRLRASKADVSWVKTSNTHLTLKFLGDITEFSVIAIEEALKGLLEDQEPFDLQLKGIGCFPNLERPRVVWAGINDERKMLADLFNRLEAAFDVLGFPKEKRGFSPHITLGRLRSNSGKLALTKAVMDHADSLGPRFQVNGATLFRSDLNPSGAIHTPLVIFRFGDS